MLKVRELVELLGLDVPYPFVEMLLKGFDPVNVPSIRGKINLFSAITTSKFLSLLMVLTCHF